MEEYQVYQDIKARTNGEIYIGVVGPVRTGKSTFIKTFMNQMVIPNILDENDHQLALDELHAHREEEVRSHEEQDHGDAPDGGVDGVEQLNNIHRYPF